MRWLRGSSYLEHEMCVQEVRGGAGNAVTGSKANSKQ